MAPATKKSQLVNIADVLPEPISGDREVKVTRQRGFTPEARELADPFANEPVIQADPEIVVTRQKGILHVDEGAGYVRMDVPADFKDGKAVASGRVIADQAVAADAPVDEKTQTLDSPHLAFHKPIQGGTEKVARLGIKTAADAEEYLHGKEISQADRPAKGVQLIRHQAAAGPSDEQIKAFAAGKHFASDVPNPADGKGQVLSFAGQQMDPRKLGKKHAKGKKAKTVKAKAASPVREPREAKAPKAAKVEAAEVPVVGETAGEKKEREEKDEA
jgi:hypothetical protein